MKRLTLLAIFAACGLASAAPDLSKGKQAAMVCSGCHMVDGNSTIAMYPKIAGQHSDYIFKQMLDIKKGERKTGNSAVMAPIVQNMSEADMHNIAAYFATQQAKAGEANPKANPELGKTIFRSGLPGKSIPACMSCHGPAGAGYPAGGTTFSGLPRVGGEQEVYISDQLHLYAKGERKSPNSIMEDIASRMSEDDIRAVSTYIQGLK